MKQFTSIEQTAKLIKLGFEKPKGWCVEGISSRLIMYKHKEDDEDFNYSIGELIEMLPTTIVDEDSEYSTVSIYYTIINWVVEYSSPKKIFYTVLAIELIDALYDMVVKLKEKEVI